MSTTTAAKRIILITGANNGIGYESARALYKSLPETTTPATTYAGPYHILAGSRSRVKGDTAVARIRTEAPSSPHTLEMVELDLHSDASIAAVAAGIAQRHGRLDILINNAGVNRDLDHVRGLLTAREQFQLTFDVNVSGTHVVTLEMAPLLLRSSDPRLIFVSGLAMLTRQAESYFPVQDLAPGWPKTVGFETVAYKCSKVALSMLMLDWKHKLRADGVKVWCMAPGMNRTGLGGLSPEELEKIAPGVQHPEVAGEFMRRLVEGERDGDEGKIVSKEGGVVPW